MRNSLLLAILLFFLPPAALPAGPLWDRIRGCTSEGLVKNETDLKSLAQYRVMRDKIKVRNRRKRRAAIVITGDSLAAYFQPAWLKRYLPGLDIANRGIPGDTTVRLLGRLESDVLSLQPHTVIISIGGNDLLNGRCPGKIIENIRLLMLMIRKHRPDAKIILTSIPPTSVARANKIAPDYNDDLGDLARENGALYLDLWPLLADKKGKRIDPRFQADSIHINEEGYRLWADSLRSLLK